MASTLLPDPSDGFSQFLPTTLDDVAGAMTGEAPENMNTTTVPVDTPEAVTPEVVAQEAEELEAAAETPATLAGEGLSVPTEEETSLPEAMHSTAPPKDYVTLFEDKVRRSDQERARREQETRDKWTIKYTEENDSLLLDGDAAWKNINHSYEPDQKLGQQNTLVDRQLRVHLYKEKMPETEAGRNALRSKVAHLLFNGRGANSDEEFLEEMKKAAQGRRSFKQLSGSMSEEAVKSMLIQSLEPGSKKARTFEDWRKENSDRISPEHDGIYLEMWHSLQDSTRESLHNSREKLSQVWTAMKQGDAGSPSEVLKAFGGDILNSASGGEKGGTTLTQTRAEMAQENAGSVAFRIYKELPPKDRAKYISILGVLARTMPKEQQANLFSNFAKEAGAAVNKMGRNLDDYVGRNSLMLETMAGGEFTVPHTVVETAQYGEEKAREMQAAREKAQADYNLARNFRADVRKVEQEIFSPTPYLSKESQDFFSMRTLERGFYGSTGAILSSVVAAVPVIGPTLTYAQMESEAYDTLRFNFKDSDMSEENASKYAGQLSPFVSIPGMLLEKLGPSEWLGKLPILRSTMTKLRDHIPSSAMRFLFDATVSNVGETSNEVVQGLLPHIVQSVGAALSQDIKGGKWTGEGGALDGFWSQTGSTFVSVFPLSLASKHGNLSTDQRLKTIAGESDTALKAFGFTSERIAAFREAQKLGPASMAKELEEMDRTRDPRSESARAAVEELDRTARTQQQAATWLQQHGLLPRAERRPDGKWTLYDTRSNMIIGTAANADEAARMASTHAKLDAEKHADQIARVATAYQAAEATGQWAAENGRNQTTELDLSRKLSAEEQSHESDLARDRAAAQERVQGGDGSATRLVFGQSTTETEGNLRKTVNRILDGGSILTVFHEDAHALRREAHKNGVLTREDDIAIIRAVDSVLDGKTVRNRNGTQDPNARLSLLPENFDSLPQADQDVAIDEAISELMEAEIIRTRKGGGARELPAGIISRNMAAIARLAGPQAANKFGAFVEAFRSYFGLATDRAHHIRRGLADGSLDQAGYDAYFGKLTGTANTDGTAINGKDGSPSTETTNADPNGSSTEISYSISPPVYDSAVSQLEGEKVAVPDSERTHTNNFVFAGHDKDAGQPSYEEMRKKHPFLDILATIPHDRVDYGLISGRFSLTATRGDRTYKLHGRVTDRSIHIDGLFDENDDASAGSESFGVDFLATATAYAANHPNMTITTLAGRDKTMNGYSMWPKLGFEAIDPSEIIGDHVPEEAASRMRELAKTENGQLSLAKLNTTTEGRLLWKNHGDNIEVYFQAKQDSFGLSVFIAYLKKLRRRIVR